MMCVFRDCFGGIRFRFRGRAVQLRVCPLHSSNNSSSKQQAVASASATHRPTDLPTYRCLHERLPVDRRVLVLQIGHALVRAGVPA